ncbi:MAG: DinB family protein [Pedobacter sp.]|nr:MAG: DinB family protein [Pedobacter sp.]
MKLNEEVAKHFRDVYSGDNWTSVNLQDTLHGITWEQANTKIRDLHTIAELLFHINYYVDVVLKRLKGEPLVASDTLSFTLPPIENEHDWQLLIDKVASDAEAFTDEIRKIADHDFEKNIADPKYGSYYRNIHGIVEHNHYHLGQIVLLKKLIQTVPGNNVQ